VSCDAANALMKRMFTAPHSVALVGKGVDKIAKRLA